MEGEEEHKYLFRVALEREELEKYVEELISFLDGYTPYEHFTQKAETTFVPEATK